MKELFKAFNGAGHELFYVGGYVRDKLRGVASDDIDFATSATPEQTMATLQRAGFKVIPIGIEFGTIQTLVDGEKVEITTYRCDESYTKGSRHPTVSWGDELVQDLARRDFTFNAIAIANSATDSRLFPVARRIHEIPSRREASTRAAPVPRYEQP